MEAGGAARETARARAERLAPQAETALDALAEALGRGAARVVLRDAEPGAGAGLAAALGARLDAARFHTVHVPYGALQAGEICAWVMGLLDEPAEGDPEAALAAAAGRRAARGETLVVVVSETQAMPVATARRLVALLEQTGDALRLVLLLEDGERAERLREAFEPVGEAHLAAPAADAAPAPARARAEGALPGPITLPYVPRAETERVLDGLEQALRRGEEAALLTGRPGIGKTVVLRALERRLRSGFTPLRVPYASLGPEAFARFALALLERAVAEGEAEAALLAHAAACARAGMPLVLLVDDAHAAPAETHARLLAWTSREGGPSAVWCLSGPVGERLPEALRTVTARYELDSLLDEAESGAFVRAWLEAAGAPEDAWQALDAAALGALHARARGLPAALAREADAWLRSAPRAAVPPPAPPSDAAPGQEAPADRPCEPAAAAAVDTAPAETRPPLPRRPRGPRRRSVAAALALVGAALGVGYALRDGRLEGAARAPAPPTASTQRDSSGPVPAPPEAAIPEATAAPRPAPSPAPAGSPDAGRAAPAPAPPDPIPVHINAVPWARIRIDGRELGTTPLGNVPLAPGAHRLEAHFADGRVLEREVQVSAEQRHLVLEP